MVDGKTLYSIPNGLYLERRKLPILVTACWVCGEIGYVSANCLKMPERAPGHIRNSLSPPMVKDKKVVPVVSPADKIMVPFPVGKTFLPSSETSLFPTTKVLKTTEKSKGKVVDSRKMWENSTSGTSASQSSLDRH